MPRFILIDHSIKGFGGHHYEYAVHVLDAARRAGLETILAVNQSFNGARDAELPWRIIPVYERGFWGSPPPPAAKNAKWKARLFDAYIRTKFSAFGQTLSVIPAFRQHYTPASIMAESRNKLEMFLLMLGLFVFKWPYRIFEATWALLRTAIAPAHDYFARLGPALAHLGLQIIFPLRVFAHFGKFARALKKKKHVSLNEFGRDTIALFQQVPLEKDDIVFIPTLSERDMLGLNDFFAANPSAHQASWHLLFRRNIFHGGGSRLQMNTSHFHPTKLSFRQFRANLNGHEVRFYTDTERLTDEYNCLAVGTFRTLPIPINPGFTAPRSAGATDRPLRIVYAGDARVEKGFHYLPDVVRDLWRGGHGENVVFDIQSNFAHARPEDATAEKLALEELQSFPRPVVRLFNEPLDSQKYFDLVSSADILLLLYDPMNYYARSSGILVEALAAGIPVVAPVSSWMGQQLARAHYEYLLRAPDRGDLVGRHGPAELRWPQWHGPAHQSTGQVWFRGAQQAAFAAIRPDAGATHMLITFDRPSNSDSHVLLTMAESRRKDPHQPMPASDASLEVDNFREVRTARRLLVPAPGCEKCAAMVQLRPDIDAVVLGFRNGCSEATISINHLEVAFLRERPGQPLMLESVGSAYLQPEEIGRHLKEVVRNYDHYRRTALDFARAWNDHHSADRLVKELIA